MAFVAIFGLHALALALGLAMKGPRPDPPPPAPPIVVSLLAESRERAEPPAAKPRLQEVLPQPVSPLIQIALIAEQPPAAISVAAAPTTPPPPGATEMVDAGDASPVEVSEPDYLQVPRIVYPPAARRARAQGLVHVRVLVDEEGRPAEVSVVKSSGFELLDGAACSAVRGALFKPYRRNNVARSMVVIVPIEFSIRARG